MRYLSLCTVLLLPLLAACEARQVSTSPEAPVAKVVPTELEMHGDVRVDDYYWLREREDPEVIEYLEAENAYTEAVMAHTEAFQDQLYEEIVARIKEDDSSVPYLEEGYWYYRNFVEDGEYAVYCRKEGDLEAEEEIILDGNQLAEGHEFFSLSGVKVSPDSNILAYSTDTVGRRFYTIRFRDLETGEDLPDVIENVTPNIAWANDSKTIFYAKQHPETLRWYQIYKHVLGTDPAEDQMVYEEMDEEFSAYVGKTRSKDYILVLASQTLSSEIRYLDANDPDSELLVLQPREENHEYIADHLNGEFYIRTNWMPTTSA